MATAAVVEAPKVVETGAGVAAVVEVETASASVLLVAKAGEGAGGKT